MQLKGQLYSILRKLSSRQFSFAGKLANEDDDILLSSNTASVPIPMLRAAAAVTTPATTTTEAIEIDQLHTEEATTKATEVRDLEPTEIKQPRLLNLNVDDLQSFANALHNDSRKDEKKMPDLSDVNLDDDDEDAGPSRMTQDDHDHKSHHNKQISDKFYTNLQVPFHPLMSIDRVSSAEETDTCKENGVPYKVGIILTISEQCFFIRFI